MIKIDNKAMENISKLIEELENFNEFYEKRKEILTVKIRQLLG